MHAPTDHLRALTKPESAFSRHSDCVKLTHQALYNAPGLLNLHVRRLLLTALARLCKSTSRLHFDFEPR